MLLVLVAAIATAGAIYFGAEWYSASRLYKGMTKIERANAQIEEERQRNNKVGIKARAEKALRDRGYKGDWLPVILVISVLYMVLAVILTLIGIGTIWGAVIALPAAIMVAAAGLSSARRKQQKLFQVQLMQALGLIATQIESGDGAKRAIEKTVGLVEDPLRSEMMNSLDSIIGSSRTVVDAFKDLSDRYPSRAMNLFVTALEIDERMGAKLGPALRQAQTALEREFELTAEANAEISQAKSEFYGIASIAGFIVVWLVATAEGISRDAYSSPIGMIAIGVVAANYALGIFRTFRVFRSTEGNF